MLLTTTFRKQCASKYLHVLISVYTVSCCMGWQCRLDTSWSSGDMSTKKHATMQAAAATCVAVGKFNWQLIHCIWRLKQECDHPIISPSTPKKVNLEAACHMAGWISDADVAWRHSPNSSCFMTASSSMWFTWTDLNALLTPWSRSLSILKRHLGQDNFSVMCWGACTAELERHLKKIVCRHTRSVSSYLRDW